MLSTRGVPTSPLPFDRLLARVVSPALASLGFVTDGRILRRAAPPRSAPHTVQLVEFQTGVKGQAVGFTVNLGVFNPALWLQEGTNLQRPCTWDCHPDLWTRLGHLVPPPPQTWVSRLLGQPVPAPEDRWWPLGEREERAVHTLGEVLSLVEQHGLPWLDAHATPAAFVRASQALLARKATASRLRPEPELRLP